jgi:hypothetical protein
MSCFVVLMHFKCWRESARTHTHPHTQTVLDWTGRQACARSAQRGVNSACFVAGKEHTLCHTHALVGGVEGAMGSLSFG